MRYPAPVLALVRYTCAAALCLLTPASAREREFVELTTPGYVVVSDLSEAKTRRIALDVANFQAIIALFTNARDLTPRVPTRIYALSARDWEEYAKPWRDAGGVFYDTAFANDMVLDAQSYGSEMYRIVFHEYTHYAVSNNSTYEYPAWFEEGLAEVLSTVEFNNKVVMIGKVPVDRWITIDQSAWLPLETVFAVKHSSPEYHSHRVTPAFYAQSWALLHYAIFEKPLLMKGLNAYVRALTDGRSNEEAFSKTVGVDYGELDKELRAYAGRTRFKYLVIQRGGLSQVATLDAPARSLTADESALELADLVVRVGNDPLRVQDLYKSVLKKEPHNSRAISGMAVVLESQKQGAQADQMLADALAFAPADPLLLETEANILLDRVRSNGHGFDHATPETVATVKKIRELLRPVVAQEPLRLQAISTYGWTYTFGGGSDDDAYAVALVEKALLQVPKSGELAYVQALLCERDGHPQQAAKAWENVYFNARSATLRIRAARALNEAPESGN
jgi:hypothetical protein